MNVKILIVISFLFLFCSNLYSNGVKENIKNPDYSIIVEGMTCSLCSKSIEKKLIDLDWILDVNADHKTGIVLIKVENQPDVYEIKRILKSEIDSLSFSINSIKESENGKQ